MMKPVIPASVALQFNERVRNHIDARLFVFCNYEPTPSYMLNNDGLFATAIQDIYKFSIDSCYILSHCTDILPPNQRSLAKSIDDLLQNIRNLRSVFDHNHSPKNGLIEKERLDWYRTWLFESLGKDSPESDDDFHLLYSKLISLAEQLVDQVDKLLTVIESMPALERDEVAYKWLMGTLYWYSSRTKRDLYMAQLESTYQAKAASKGNFKESDDDSAGLSRKMKKWIQKALVQDSERKKAEIISYTKLINSIPGMDPEVIARIEKNDGRSIEEIKNGILSQIDVLEKLCSKIDDVTDSTSKSYAYFFDNLPIQLRETVRTLDIAHEDYSILPHDLMQRDIAIFFKGVDCPEGFY